MHLDEFVVPGTGLGGVVSKFLEFFSPTVSPVFATVHASAGFCYGTAITCVCVGKIQTGQVETRPTPCVIRKKKQRSPRLQWINRLRKRICWRCSVQYDFLSALYMQPRIT